MKIKLFCSFAVTFAVGTGALAQSGIVRSEVATGVEATELRGEIRQYDRSIQQRVGDYQSLLKRARCYLQLGEYEKAIADCDLAIKLNPCTANSIDSAAAHKGRNSAAAHKGSNSTHTGSNALADSLTLSRSFQCRAMAKFYTNRMAEGIEDTTKAIELRPNFAENYRNRGTAYLNLHQYKLAKEDFDRPSKFGKDDARINAEMDEIAWNKEVERSKRSWAQEKGMSRQEIKKKVEEQARAGIKALSEKLEDDPSSRNYHLSRGKLYYNLHQYKEAIDDFTKVLNIGSRRRMGATLDLVYFKRAAAYRALKQYDRAIADYNAIIAMDPEDEDAYCDRGRCYLAQGDKTRALKDYNKSISLDPKNAGTAYLARANLFDLLGKKNMAQKDRETANSLGRSTQDPF